MDDGAAVLQRVPGGAVRAADADRERVALRLARAHAEGRLDLREFDERVRHAWAARTYDELGRVTADLPAEHVPRPGPARRRPAQRHDQRGAVAVWLTASLVSLVIWALVCLATASVVHPWWIWVAGPWGAVLLAHAVGERVRRA